MNKRRKKDVDFATSGSALPLSLFPALTLAKYETLFGWANKHFGLVMLRGTVLLLKTLPPRRGTSKWCKRDAAGFAARVRCATINHVVYSSARP